MWNFFVKVKKKKEKKKEKEKRHVQLLWKSFPQQLYYTKYIQLLCKTITLYFIIELKKKEKKKKEKSYSYMSWCIRLYLNEYLSI
jgi:uncharacterized protein Veg